MTPNNTLQDIHSTEHKYYPIADVLRLCCALMVVFIHIFEIHSGHPIAQIILDGICGQAVPFFFAVSGFFFRKNMIKQNVQSMSSRITYTSKYIKHILLIYAVWTLLHIPSIISVYHSLYPDASIPYFCGVIFRRVIFAGYGAYWYLLVLAESALVVALLSANKALRKLTLIISVVGLIWLIAYDTDLQLPVVTQLNKLIYYSFSWSNNLIMKGIPFFAIGFYINEITATIPILKNKYIVVISYAIISIICIALCNVCGEIVFILLPIQVLLLFLIGLFPTQKIQIKTSRMCRNMSTVFYFTHSVFIYFVIDELGLLYASIPLRYGLAIGLCLLTYFLITKLDIKPLKWLTMVK